MFFLSRSSSLVPWSESADQFSQILLSSCPFYCRSSARLGLGDLRTSERKSASFRGTIMRNLLRLVAELDIDIDTYFTW